MSSAGHIADRDAAVRQVLRSSLVEAVMHHRHVFVFHSLRHFDSMEVDMHKLRQSAIELLSVTDKTSSHIQEMLVTCQS